MGFFDGFNQGIGRGMENVGNNIIPLYMQLQQQQIEKEKQAQETAYRNAMIQQQQEQTALQREIHAADVPYKQQQTALTKAQVDELARKTANEEGASFAIRNLPIEVNQKGLMNAGLMSDLNDPNGTSDPRALRDVSQGKVPQGYAGSFNLPTAEQRLNALGQYFPMETAKEMVDLEKTRIPKTEPAVADARRYQEVQQKIILKMPVSSEDLAWSQAYEKRETLKPNAYGSVRLEIAKMDKPTTTPGITYSPKRGWRDTEGNQLNTADVQKASLAYKELIPTNDIKVMQQSVPSVLTLLQQARTDMKNVELGPAAGRWQEGWSGKIGAAAPSFRKLKTDIGLLQTRLMKMHVGARGSDTLLAHFQEMGNASKDAPENLQAFLDTVETYANEVGMPLDKQREAAGLNQGKSNNSKFTISGIPQSAIDYLKQNPGQAAFFDMKYGAGASKQYLRAR
jgi:hypothetical protein